MLMRANPETAVQSSASFFSWHHMVYYSWLWPPERGSVCTSHKQFYAWNGHFGAYLFCRTSVHKSCLRKSSHVPRLPKWRGYNRGPPASRPPHTHILLQGSLYSQHFVIEANWLFRILAGCIGSSTVCCNSRLCGLCIAYIPSCHMHRHRDFFNTCASPAQTWFVQ